MHMRIIKINYGSYFEISFLKQILLVGINILKVCKISLWKAFGFLFIYLEK